MATVTASATAAATALANPAAISFTFTIEEVVEKLPFFPPFDADGILSQLASCCFSSPPPPEQELDRELWSDTGPEVLLVR